MFSNTKGFTLTELIVVIVILSILSTVGFIRYTGYQASARDSTRKADISSLQISLSEYKRSRGSYPTPGTPQAYAYSGMTIAIQGIIDEDTGLSSTTSVATDPLLTRSYAYAISGRKNQYMLMTTLEAQGSEEMAYITTDYRRSAVSILPSLGYATASYGNITNLYNTAILDKSSRNIPYVLDQDSASRGQPRSSAATYADVVSESGVKELPKAVYDSCSDIALNLAYIGTGSYYVRDAQEATSTTTCDTANIGN